MPVRTIYTLGTSILSQEEFINLLKLYRIKRIIDVRRFPTSRWEHFKKKNLQEILKKEGISYLYLGKELGGFRKGGYQEYMKTDFYRQGIEKLERSATSNFTAILCAEKVPWRCHRQFIAKTLSKKGWRIVHVIDQKRVWKIPPQS